MQSSSTVVTKSHPKKLGPSVTVTTTARAHFGFLDPSGRTKAPFGSFGLSLNQPQTRLQLAHSSTDTARGPEADRAARYLKTIAAAYSVDRPYRLEVFEAIPPHAGLGSGTQLALAVGAAFCELEGLDVAPLELAAKLGRGTRSGIGIATFEMGGAVLDTGPRAGALPELAAHFPFPEDWPLLLIFDPHAKGLDGADEVAAFEALPTFPEEARAELEACIVRQALPAIECRDFASFSEAVGHLQKAMGAYFAPLQGGPFTSKRVEAVIERLRAKGIAGLGQSSWGPTGFAFAPSRPEAENLLQMAQKADDSGVLQFRLANARNAGAEIALAGPEDHKRQGSAQT